VILPAPRDCIRCQPAANTRLLSLGEFSDSSTRGHHRLRQAVIGALLGGTIGAVRGGRAEARSDRAIRDSRSRIARAVRQLSLGLTAGVGLAGGATISTYSHLFRILRRPLIPFTRAHSHPARRRF